jgi:hypothetical protein
MKKIKNYWQNSSYLDQNLVKLISLNKRKKRMCNFVTCGMMSRIRQNIRLHRLRRKTR